MTGDVGEDVIGNGRDALLIDLGNGRLLRRFRTPHPVDTEAALMTYVAAAGYPVPRVFETRPPDEIVIERIEGPTMHADLAAHPWRLEHHARILADLHRRLHEIEAPPYLPAPYGEPEAEPAVVLHNDLIWKNVVLGPDGPVVIDWTDAARGPAGADIADAWLSMDRYRFDKPGGGVGMQMLKKPFAGLFVRRFLHHTDRAAAEEWLTRVAARRSADASLTQRRRDGLARLAQRR